jgi:hypothetical protein
VLLLLPADFFDTGQSLCISQLLLHKECLGCGITRAVHHFIHLEFQTAWNFNKLVVIVLPILIFIWGDQVYKTFLSLQTKTK